MVARQRIPVQVTWKQLIWWKIIWITEKFEYLKDWQSDEQSIGKRLIKPKRQQPGICWGWHPRIWPGTISWHLPWWPCAEFQHETCTCVFCLRDIQVAPEQHRSPSHKCRWMDRTCGEITNKRTCMLSYIFPLSTNQE